MWLKAAEQPKTEACKITCSLKRQPLQLHVPHMQIPSYLKWLYCNLVTPWQCPCRGTRRKEIPSGPQFIRYVYRISNQDQELTICRLLGPLDWVKASSDTCGGPGRGSATSEGCGWGCTWSWPLRPSWSVCTAANIGGGDGCRMMFTISVGPTDPESGQRAGSPTVSKETAGVDTTAGCEGKLQLWFRLQHKCPRRHTSETKPQLDC